MTGAATELEKPLTSDRSAKKRLVQTEVFIASPSVGPTESILRKEAKDENTSSVPYSKGYIKPVNQIWQGSGLNDDLFPNLETAFSALSCVPVSGTKMLQWFEKVVITSEISQGIGREEQGPL